MRAMQGRWLVWALAAVSVGIAPGVGVRAADEVWEIRGQVRTTLTGTGEVVVLELADGRRLEVPVAAMTEASRDRARRTVAASGTAATAGAPLAAGGGRTAAVSDVATQLEAVALICRHPRDMANLCRVVLADPTLTSVQVAELQDSLGRWTTLAAEGKVRRDKVWVPADEVEKGNREAESLVDHAVELMRLGNAKLVMESLEKASRVGVTSVRGDFLAAMLLLLQRTPDFAGAANHFAEVLQRQPGNAAALNNLAVCEVMARRPDLAARHFRKALNWTGNGQAVVDNVGFTVAAANIPRTNGPKMSAKALEEFNGLYRTMAQELGMKARAEAGGLTFIGLKGETCAAARLTPSEAITLAGDVTSEAAREGSWLGVVVAPGRVITVADAVISGGRLTVTTSGDRPIPLEVQEAALLDGTGLAVIECQGLKAEPFKVAMAAPTKGVAVRAGGGRRKPLLAIEEVVAAGYVVPSAAASDAGVPLVIHDAAIPDEVGGGPICDDRGRLVGISVPLPVIEGSDRFRAGIAAAVLEAIGLEAADATESLSAEDLETRMNEGTVIVSIRRESEPRSTPVGERPAEPVAEQSPP
jgi:hypothetical protein